jgi:hypothetical protein
VKLDRAGLNWIGSDSGITTRRAVVPVLVLLCLKAYSPLNRSFRFVRHGLFCFHVTYRVGVGVRLLTAVVSALPRTDEYEHVVGLIIRAKRSSQSYLAIMRTICQIPVSDRTRWGRGRSSQDATKLRRPTTQSNPFSRLARMHVKMSSNTEAVGCSDMLPSSSHWVSPMLHMRHAVGAILQHPSSAHGKSLRGACVLQSINLIGGANVKQHHLALSEA